jgi:formate dehydrogenase major subunit
MSETVPATPIRFALDGRQLTALPGETIWQAARRAGTTIPHLCTHAAPDYRPGGNCRACMVEIDGERNLAASCSRQVSDGMEVRSETSERALNSRRLVMELLLADQPPRAQAHDRNALFWHWAGELELPGSRFPQRTTTANTAPRVADRSHPAMTVQLDACIHCQLCVQACRDIQANDVIGMAGRGAAAKIVFDLDDAMGDSSCVGCGECVQACPTGALMATTMLAADGSGLLAAGERVDRVVASVCPYCGVGCQIDYQLRQVSRSSPSLAAMVRPTVSRLCVKGRFGFDYVHSPQRLLTPLIRRDDAPKVADAAFDPANPLTRIFAKRAGRKR